MNFKFSTFLSYEARNPCLRVGVVMGGNSGQCDHPFPVEADHLIPVQIDHPLSYS